MKENRFHKDDWQIGYYNSKYIFGYWEYKGFSSSSSITNKIYFIR
jgi:hypothetical protein